MKPTNIFLAAFLMILVVSNAHQAKAQIKDLSLKSSLLTLKVHKEICTQYYAIEGSLDSLNFEPIEILKPKTISMLPTNYSVDVSALEYRWFRVRRIGTDNRITYSKMIASDHDIDPMSPSQITKK